MFYRTVFVPYFIQTHSGLEEPHLKTEYFTETYFESDRM